MVAKIYKAPQFSGFQPLTFIFLRYQYGIRQGSIHAIFFASKLSGSSPRELESKPYNRAAIISLFQGPTSSFSYAEQVRLTVDCDYFGLRNVCKRLFPLLRPYARYNLNRRWGCINLLQSISFCTRLYSFCYTNGYCIQSESGTGKHNLQRGGRNMTIADGTSHVRSPEECMTPEKVGKILKT